MRRPTFGDCLSAADRAGPVHGFTLIEMLIVMVLLGLLSALALPAMQRWHDVIQVRAQAAAVLDALRAAAFSAGASRRDIVMDENSFSQAVPAPAAAASGPDPSPLQASEAPAKRPALAVILPAGWLVKRVVSATFLSNGLCRPGLVALQTERGEPVTIQVRGPVCGVELIQASAAT